MHHSKLLHIKLIMSLLYMWMWSYVGGVSFTKHVYFSEITSEGRRITKLDQILLNGNNIAIVSMTQLRSISPKAYLSHFISLLPLNTGAELLFNAVGPWWLTRPRMRCSFSVAVLLLPWCVVRVEKRSLITSHRSIWIRSTRLWYSVVLDCSDRIDLEKVLVFAATCSSKDFILIFIRGWILYYSWSYSIYLCFIIHPI